MCFHLVCHMEDDIGSLYYIWRKYVLQCIFLEDVNKIANEKYSWDLKNVLLIETKYSN